MLVLSRWPHERIRLRLPDGSVIWITAVEVRSGGLMRIGIDADRAIQIEREEIIADADDEDPRRDRP